ncbi:hypothetical protein N665_0012s0265 [Sinapis alba]|nr:hypothetical protein N665_0012s0265 [Sinapis alba]
MAFRTLFTIINFPAVDKNLLVQLFAFCLILSTIEANKSFFRRPKCSGARLEKVIDDFVGLIYWPEADSYLDRMSLRALPLSLEAEVKNMVSSANRR